MSRRANGEGSIYKRKDDGKWCASFFADDLVTGERRRFLLYGKTRTEVTAKLRAARERADAGAPVRDSSATVAEWLAHWRETALAASNRKDSTKALYRTMSKKHLEPEPFGGIRLDRLKPSDIDRLILALRAKKRTSNKGTSQKALASATVNRIFRILRSALDDAVRDGLLARNPATAVRQPAVPRTEARFLSRAEVAAILHAAEASRYHDLLALIAATGLRKGEALALKWEDIDLAAASLRVRGTLARLDGKLTVTTPKTAKSRRTLPLSPAVVTLLKEHRKRQFAERWHAGSAWQESGFVFTTEMGTAIEPRNVLRALTDAARTAKVEGSNVHALRHAAATAMLENGAHLKTVSDMLGHANIATTGDIYAHVTDEAARAAMDGLSEAFGL